MASARETQTQVVAHLRTQTHRHTQRDTTDRDKHTQTHTHRDTHAQRHTHTHSHGHSCNHLHHACKVSLARTSQKHRGPPEPTSLTSCTCRAFMQTNGRETPPPTGYTQHGPCSPKHMVPRHRTWLPNTWLACHSTKHCCMQLQLG